MTITRSIISHLAFFILGALTTVALFTIFLRPTLIEKEVSNQLSINYLPVKSFMTTHDLSYSVQFCFRYEMVKRYAQKTKDILSDSAKDLKDVIPKMSKDDAIGVLEKFDGLNHQKLEESCNIVLKVK